MFKVFLEKIFHPFAVPDVFFGAKHFIHLLKLNNKVRCKIIIFLYHNFPFYQNEEFFFCRLA